MSHPAEEFPFKRFALNSRPSRRPSFHSTPSTMVPVSQVQDWHSTPSSRQSPAAASRQRPYNPNAPQSPLSGQRHGDVVNSNFPRTQQVPKQTHQSMEEAMRVLQEEHEVILRDLEQMGLALNDVSIFAAQMHAGMLQSGVREASKNESITSGENQAEAPMYENTTVGPNFSEMVDWTMP